MVAWELSRLANLPQKNATIFEGVYVLRECVMYWLFNIETNELVQNCRMLCNHSRKGLRREMEAYLCL